MNKTSLRDAITIYSVAALAIIAIITGFLSMGTNGVTIQLWIFIGCASLIMIISLVDNILGRKVKHDNATSAEF